MLERITDIEGLDRFQDHVLLDDTPPNAGRFWFTVESEDMPFLTNDPVSNPRGEIIRKNFVYFNYEMELGRMSGRRRIKDTVEYDEVARRWKVVKLHPDPKVSHILRFKDAWNAFARGTTLDEVGTPIKDLFKLDPSRAEHYKRLGIHTVERLSSITEADADSIGMGGRDDRKKAILYMERSRESVKSAQANARHEAQERLIASQAEKIADLSAKLEELLRAQLEAQEAEKPVKKTKKQVSEQLEA
jgi:hypothetical protein